MKRKLFCILAMLAGVLGSGIARTQEAPTKPLVEPYGYIKADAAWQDQHMYPGNYGVWVYPETLKNNDNEFFMTANETRLGFKVKGPDTDIMKVKGQIEADFYGGGAAENKAVPMMRHAFIELTWPASNLSVIAGQTWDVIAPLNPVDLNYTVMWYAGNIGYRRPQVRVTQGILLGEDRVDMTLAAARTIGQGSAVTQTAATCDSGSDAGFPMAQGRIGFTFKSFAIGFSGHYGQEEYDTHAQGDSVQIETLSGGVDMSWPLMSGLTLKGEWWAGKNMAAFLGAIAQSQASPTAAPVRAHGGWSQLMWNATSDSHYGLAGGADMVEPDDVASAGRTANYIGMVNALYDLNASTQWGVELSWCRTLYKDSSRDSDALRVQTSLKYSF